MISRNLPVTKFGVNRVFRFKALCFLTDYSLMSSMIFAKSAMALKRNFPVIWCDQCQKSTTVSNIAISVLINSS